MRKRKRHDAGFEGRNTVVLVEAMARQPEDFHIRQLCCPYRLWKIATGKQVINVFFVKSGDIYKFWQYTFDDEMDYNSIRLVKAEQFQLIDA